MELLKEGDQIALSGILYFIDEVRCILRMDDISSREIGPHFV